MLKTSGLYFLYIFRVFKMTHSALGNGPFCCAEWLILTSKMSRFTPQNGPFWKSDKFFFPFFSDFLLFRKHSSL